MPWNPWEEDGKLQLLEYHCYKGILKIAARYQHGFYGLFRFQQVACSTIQQEAYLS